MQVDSLNIEISAQANSAIKSLDKLAGKLNVLPTVLGKIDTSGLTRLANGVNRVSTAMQSIKSAGTADFTRLAKNAQKFGQIDISSINKSAGAISQMSRGFAQLGNISVSDNAAKLGELAKGISQLGYKSATQAIENIPRLATAMRGLMQTLSTAPKVSQNLIDMTNAMARFARTGASGGEAANALSRSFTRLAPASTIASKSIRGMQNNFHNLFRSIAPFIGLYEIFRFGKNAVDTASSLTEVQNVVDVTFGKYANLVEKMSETSIEDYGMSELTVKQISSRFQAMGTAMGFTQGKMADMSIELTKLAGDMASFYNAEQTDIAKSLQSIFTGETEPMRQYGVDLTNLTLKEWAMKQGLDANIQSMTQAEKTLLRYQYVMANTGAAQGDFARTADTWANQIRTLKENFEDLSVVIGTAFINLLKPVITVLNTIVKAVTNFAETVVNALGVIFGWKLEITSNSVAQDYEDAAGYANDLAGGTGKAADNAKKLKQQLQGFDELNVLTSDDGSGSGGGSGGGGGAGGFDGSPASGSKFSIKETESLFESELDTLYKLGDYIGKTLTDSLNSIDWDSVYEGARNFGKGLANFLNGLISPDLFGALGRTIAGSINTVLYSTLSFAETFDWTNLGDSIAAGINEFFATYDFSATGKNITTWAKGIITAIVTALDKTDWKQIGKKIGELINSIKIGDLALSLGELALNILAALGDAIKGLWKENPLAAAITTLVLGVRFTSKLDILGSQIVSALGLGIRTADKSGVQNAISNVFSGTSFLNAPLSKFGTLTGTQMLGAVLLGLEAAFTGFSFGKWLYENTDLGKVEDKLIEAFAFDLDGVEPKGDYETYYNKALDFFADQETGAARENARKVTDNWQTYLAQGFNSTDAWNLAMQDAEELGGTVDGLTRTVDRDAKKVSKDIDYVNKKFGTYADNFPSVGKKVSNYSQNFVDSTGKIKESTTALFDYTKDAFTGADRSLTESQNKIKDSTFKSVNVVNNGVDAMATNTRRSMSSMSSGVVASVTSMNSNVGKNFASATASASQKSRELASVANSNFLVAATSAAKNFTSMKDTIGNRFSEGASLALSGSKKISENANSNFSTVSVGANTAFSKLVSTVSINMRNALNAIGGIKTWNGIGVNLVQGLQNGITNSWNGSLISKVVALAKSLTKKIQSVFIIRSPSHLWRDEVGVYLAEGLGVGIEKGEGSVLRGIDSFAGNITTRMAKNLNNPFENFNSVLLNASAKINGTVTSSLDNGNLASEISMGISYTQSEQNSLLREQNELLREQNELLLKLPEYGGISPDDIYNTVRRKNRQNYNQTGRNALVY